MPTSMANPERPGAQYLSVTDLTVGYGAAPIIKEVSLSAHLGEIVTVIGPNGAGKSTLLKALTGRLTPQNGTIRLDGVDVTHATGNALTRIGVGYVPQHNDIFPTLTVRENLEMGGYILPKSQLGARIEAVLNKFPTLTPLLNRTGKLLSGGERKLLGIGRCLVSSPKILILDEPTAALSPILANAILQEHITSLATDGTTILLIEQRAHQAMQISNWCYVLVAGKVEISSAPAPLLAQKDFGELFLGKTPQPRPSSHQSLDIPQPSTDGPADRASSPR